jgi:hypothetical protein
MMKSGYSAVKSFLFVFTFDFTLYGLADSVLKGGEISENKKTKNAGRGFDCLRSLKYHSRPVFFHSRLKKNQTGVIFFQSCPVF